MRQPFFLYLAIYAKIIVNRIVTQVIPNMQKTIRYARKTALIFLALVIYIANCQAIEQILLNPDGPDADKLGQAKGYTSCNNPQKFAECRIGAWSGQFDTPNIAVVKAASQPSALPYMSEPPAIHYRWGLFNKSVDDYLEDTKATSLIILKNGQVVLERYQYDRKPEMRFRSFSMSKTIISILIGIANKKGHILSLDDPVSKYWPEISRSAYGQTSIRNMLRMSSGINFNELYTFAPGDDNWEWGKILYDRDNAARPDKIVQYLNSKTERTYEEGTKFSYASIITEVLGRVLIRATGQSIAMLTQEWLWQPMGAQSDALWFLSTTDSVEGAGGSFNATLRDYARLGNLLANDGMRDGVEIIPTQYLLEATDVALQPLAFKPKVATPYFGYGYQIWLFPMKKRTFALQGIFGQQIYVQPESKIVMVQTSAFDKPSGRFDPYPYKKLNALWLGILDSLGGDSSQ